MDIKGIQYIAETSANLMGIPCRIYEGGKLVSLFSTVKLVKDPFSLYMDKLDEGEGNIHYFSTPEFFYYCILKSEDIRLVFGPFGYFPISKQTAMDLSFKLEVEKEDTPRFVSSLTSISSMPLETIILSLCSTNYVLNGEMLDIADIVIADSMQKNIEKARTESIVDYRGPTSTRNATLKIEESLTKFVEDGNIEGFKEWSKTAPSIHSAALSKDFIRHQKNTFIVSVSLFSRAAIKGGLEYSEAMNLADAYINSVEKMNTYEEINNTSYSMVQDFINRVAKIKAVDSPLETKISNYVYNHISEPVNLDSYCKYTCMTKSNLCLRFKQETGKTVGQFVLETKIKESKNIIKNTDKPLSSIALYLGFSSQAHFSKAFKEICGVTPSQYKRSIK